MAQKIFVCVVRQNNEVVALAHFIRAMEPGRHIYDEFRVFAFAAQAEQMPHRHFDSQ